MSELTQRELKELIFYDPITGEFRWRIDKGRLKAGTLAGTINDAGYLCIKINYVTYRAHRLAWLHEFGVWPKSLIDHKDGNRANNVFENLREASPHQNSLNSIRCKSNKAGVKCVTWCARDQKWMAKVGFKGRYYNLGRYEDLELAELVINEFKDKYHKQFARYQKYE